MLKELFEEPDYGDLYFVQDNCVDSVSVIGGDPINHPDHYATGGVECIDWIQMALTDEEFAGYLKGNVLKYLWRMESKDSPAIDSGKLEWYAGYLHKIKTK